MTHAHMTKSNTNRKPMTRRMLAIASLVMGFSAILANASPAGASAPQDTITTTNLQPVEEESLIQGKGKSLSFSHFTWGAEVGSSLDMTGHDLSSFDVDVLLAP